MLVNAALSLTRFVLTAFAGGYHDLGRFLTWERARVVKERAHSKVAQANKARRAKKKLESMVSSA